MLKYYFLLYIFCARFNIGHTKVIVKKLENCDPNVDYPIKIYAKFRTVNGDQYVDGNLTVRVPIDDSIQTNNSLYMLMDENKSRLLYSRNEKMACTNTHKYLSEFVYDIERRVGLIPRSCPIPKGTYHLQNYPLTNSHRIALPSPPVGKLRIVTVAISLTNNIVYCLKFEFES